MQHEKNSIALVGMEILSKTGFYAEEQFTGTRFLVDVYLETDFSGIETQDAIQHTINYEDIAKIVEKVMQKPYKLIEHAAYHIKNQLLLLSENILYLKIVLKKQNPILTVKTQAAHIILEYTQAQNDENIQ